MKKMSFYLKFFLILFLPLSGLTYFAFSLIQSGIKEEKEISSYKASIDNVKLITDLIANIQNERGLSAAFLTSKGENDQKKKRTGIENQYPLTDLAINNYVKDVAANNLPNQNAFYTGLTSKELFKFRTQIMRNELSPGNAIDFYSDITDEGMVQAISQTGRISSASDINVNILISLIEAKECLGIIRANILSAINDPATLKDNINNISLQYNEYNSHIKIFKSIASEQLKEKSDLYLGSNNAQKSFGVINGMVLGKKLPDLNHEELWEYTTGLINSFQLLIDMATDDLDAGAVNLMENAGNAWKNNIILLLMLIVTTILFLYLTIRSMMKQLGLMNTAALQLCSGETVLSVPVIGNDEFGKLASSINTLSEKSLMIVQETQRIERGDIQDPIMLIGEKNALGASLEKIRLNLTSIQKESKERDWKNKGEIVLAEKMRGENKTSFLADNIIGLLVSHIQGQIGSLYLSRGEKLVLAGSYASDRNHLANELQFGEGLVGQTAKTRQAILCSDIPSNYFNVNSSLGRIHPKNIIVIPLIFNDKLEGVVEIGSINEITFLHQKFLEGVSESVGIALNTAAGREELERVKLEFSQQISALNDAAIVSETDAEGNITFINDLFCQISEYSREELMGQNHRILKSRKQPDSLFVGIWKAISNGKVWKGEIINKKKGGDYYWVDTTIMPFKNADGKIYKYVGIRFDITRQKEQQKLLENQAEKLRVQHEELQETNAELEAQTQKLMASEEELRVQQEELIQTNEEVEEKSLLLEEKNQAVNEKNELLEAASYELQQKAVELAISSKYKSEFLANMSHELRTPLNSILLLSKLLADNPEGNQTKEQIEFASVINNSGNNLLELINEILDLAKIESGKMELDIENIELKAICKSVRDMFSPIAKEKGISFSVNLGAGIPDLIKTDRIRLEQVLKNFLSNAFKFTEKGNVELIVRLPDQKESESMRINAQKFIAYEVKDTGIGIIKEKQAMVFEAFKQADGSTRRKYGGTGLGLSISREIARMLGGEILLKSEPGQGSSFSMIIPSDSSAIEAALSKEKTAETEKKTVQKETGLLLSSPTADINVVLFTPDEIPDDRLKIEQNDKVILIVEDDTAFAQALLKYVNERGYKAVVAVSGANAIPYAIKYQPVGILLDIQLPVKSGWTVMKELKENFATRHFPVHVMSSLEIKAKDTISLGAVDFMSKPIAQKELGKILDRIEGVLGKMPKKILLIDDNELHVKAIRHFICNSSKTCFSAGTVKEAFEILNKESIDCVVLDMGLPDETGYEVLETIKKNKKFEKLPIIIYTGKSLSLQEEKKLRQYASAIVIKTADSFKRLASEIALFLHLVEENKEEKNQKMPYIRDKALSGKHILMVDDDVRNIFSLTKLLEGQKMKVSSASDGNEALSILNTVNDIDMVLMDMMMPNKDGYDTTTEIRKIPKFNKMPIIAVTAKAMLGDREKCISAGASDYITKPVDGDQLLALLRVWLYK